MLIEKEDLIRTMKMFEGLNRDHRIAISASIDAYRREELMQEKAKCADKRKQAPFSELCTQ